MMIHNLSSHSTAGPNRLKTVLDLAERIRVVLHDRADITQKLSAHLESSLKNEIPLLRSNQVGNNASRAEELGCALWNSSIRVVRGMHGSSPTNTGQATRFTVHLRAFAFMLLHLCVPPHTNESRNKDLTLRNGKIGLKAAKYALASNEPDMALRVLEICSEYIDATCADDVPLFSLDSSQSNAKQQEVRALSHMKTRYLLLRIDHARTIDHWDMAEHFFSQLCSAPVTMDTELGEQAAHLYNASGNVLYNTGRLPIAILWFNRSLDVLNTLQADSTELTDPSLRLSSTALLVSAYLQASDQASVEKAWKLTHELAVLHGLGEHISTIVMQIDVLLASSPLRKDLLKQTMQRLAQSQLTDHNFDLIMRALHRVNKVNHPCAEYALRHFITRGILPDVDATQPETALMQWLEKSVVTYAFLLTNARPEGAPETSNICVLFDAILAKINRPISAKAVHAIQSLLWKNLVDVDAHTTSLWLTPLQHVLLSSSGNRNQTCICRKAIQNAITTGDFAEARASFFRIPETSQDEPLSRYLAFRVAVHQSDHAWAAESLRIIAESGDESKAMLYACAFEAQTNTSRALTLSALKTIIETSSGNTVGPILLRCVARLQIDQVDLDDSSLATSLGHVVTTFERCAESVELNMWNLDEATTEVPWWSRSAYNLALRWSDSGDAHAVLRLLKVCIRLMNRMVGSDDVKEKLLVTHFLVATALVLQARQLADHTEESLQCYLEARQHIKEYLNIWQPNNPSSNTLLSTERAFELHRFDLEAICKLKQWNELDEALGKSLAFPDMNNWRKLADIVLIIHRELGTISAQEQGTHMPKILDILQHVVNDTWRKDKNVTQAARWVRVAFSIDAAAVDKQQSDGKVAFKLLSQAADIARRGQQGSNAKYPDDELQWLASVSFNRGVDCCIVKQRDMAWNWFDAALQLARYSDDNGTLHACLHTRQAEAERYLDEQRTEVR